MTIHNQTPEETAATDAPVSEQRRTLIKASATAPLAATLFSGSALATSSLACETGDVSNHKSSAHGNSVNGDTAVRVAVDFYKRKPPNQCPSDLRSQLNRYDNDLYDINGTLYHNSGRINNVPDNILEQCYDKFGKNDPLTPEISVLVLYDECGTELGLWPEIQRFNEGGTGRPMNTSCLASIAVSDSCNII